MFPWRSPVGAGLAKYHQVCLEAGGRASTHVDVEEALESLEHAVSRDRAVKKVRILVASDTIE